jgi:hypothetical protein
LLEGERESRRVNRIEPLSEHNEATEGGKTSARGSGGRKAVLVALEAVLVAKRGPCAPARSRHGGRRRKLATRLHDGEVHKVKVFDKTATPQVQPAVVVRPEPQRTRQPIRVVTDAGASGDEDELRRGFIEAEVVASPRIFKRSPDFT